MRNEHGLTLTEILASIVIISIVITTFMLVFVQSSKTTTTSKHILDSTYYAETEMEEINHLYSKEKYKGLDGLKKFIQDERKYISKKDICDNCYGRQIDDRYFVVQLMEYSPDLGKVILKVFKDKELKNSETQMEVVLTLE